MPDIFKNVRSGGASYGLNDGTGGLICRKIPVYEVILANFTGKKTDFLNFFSMKRVVEWVNKNPFLGSSEIQKILLHIGGLNMGLEL